MISFSVGGLRNAEFGKWPFRKLKWELGVACILLARLGPIYLKNIKLQNVSAISTGFEISVLSIVNDDGNFDCDRFSLITSFSILQVVLVFDFTLSNPFV